MKGELENLHSRRSQQNSPRLCSNDFEGQAYFSPENSLVPRLEVMTALDIESKILGLDMNARKEIFANRLKDRIEKGSAMFLSKQNSFNMQEMKIAVGFLDEVLPYDDICK